MRFREFIFEDSKTGITPEQVDQMVDMFSNGLSLNAIDRKFGITGNNTVSKQIIKRIGLDAYRDQLQKNNPSGIGIKKGVTPEQVDQMVDMFSKGTAILAIGKEFGMAEKGVRQYIIDRIGVEAYKEQEQKNNPKRVGLPKGINSEQVDQIVDMFTKGMTLKEIGEKFGIFASPVRYHIKKRIGLDAFRSQLQKNQEQRELEKQRRLTQAMTKRMVQKPLTKGISAIRRTGPPSGRSY
jgi:DNA-binding NarL/FixJ family response regulator